MDHGPVRVGHSGQVGAGIAGLLSLMATGFRSPGLAFGGLGRSGLGVIS
jgi:hypothetical protein